MAKNRPNAHQQPAWSIKSGSYSEIPNEPCQWDKFLLEENLVESEIGINAKVLNFVQKNVDRFYIPTKVLKLYGMNWES